MNKLLLFLLLFPFSVLGQNHLKVFDQEMGEDIVPFVKQLLSKGFVFLETNQSYYNSDCVYLSGSCYGFENCRIDVLKDLDLNAVSVVNIRFRKEAYSDTLLKSMVSDLDKLYGKNEFYENSSSPDSYRTWTWTVLGVPVKLSVQKNGLHGDDEFFGTLHYADIPFVKLLQEKEDAKIKSHIKFMGHYVSEKNFVKNLLDDLKIWKDNDGNYRGDVGGYESLIEFIPYDFSLYIAAIKISKPKYERWIDLKNTYNTYKKLFLKKYTLLRSNENTGIRAGSSLSESDFALCNIMRGEGSYACIFEIPGGKIMMSIEPKKGSEYPEYGEVIIYYIDNQNYEKIKEEEEKDKLDDL